MEMERRGQEEDERKKKKPAAASRPWDCGSPLYDAFELASVYRVLDTHLMALPFARRPSPARDGGGRAAAAGGGTAASARSRRRGKAVARAARRTGKAVLHSICRSVTCGRRL